MANTTEADNLTTPEEMEAAAESGDVTASEVQDIPGSPEPDSEPAKGEAEPAGEAPAAPEAEAAGAEDSEAVAGQEAAAGAPEEPEQPEESEQETSELLKPLPGAVTGPEVMTRSRYALVVLAAKRAKQLREGARRLGSTTATNYLTAALEEAAEGVIGYRLADDEPSSRNDD